MPKYYVQCGPIEVVLLADSVEQAAFSALDRSLQSHVWIYDDPDLVEQDQRDHLMLEALMHLDPSVRVSERGFDRGDAVLVGTPDTIIRWHEFMIGLSRLFAAAGLAPRSMSAIAATPADNDDPSPRLPR